MAVLAHLANSGGYIIHWQYSHSWERNTQFHSHRTAESWDADHCIGVLSEASEAYNKTNMSYVGRVRVMLLCSDIKEGTNN